MKWTPDSSVRRREGSDKKQPDRRELLDMAANQN
jgi:hypothetical protein